MIFETHAHYDDKRFDADRIELLSCMKENGIGRIVNIGSSRKGAEESLRLAEQYDFIYAAIGIHPSDISDISEEVMEWLSQHAHDEKTVAIGEIGLDYYWEKDEEARARQRYWFTRQLSLAKEASLPVVIHSREAAKDTMEMMRDASSDGIRGVIHCYSYSPEQAKEYVDMGYYIGVGGVVTFANAKKLKETVAEIPLSHIVLETDSPYLAPVPYRGKRNDSTKLSYVVDEVARIRGITAEEVEEVTWENACRLFGKAQTAR